MNMMREHIIQETYLIMVTNGKAPNVVPELLKYIIMHPEKTMAVSIFERIVKAAEGAALGTETKWIMK